MISYFSIGALIVVICALIALLIAEHLRVYRLHEQAREERMDLITELLDRLDGIRVYGNNERKELLDRIQAPDFNNLKAAEIRTIKAQSNEEPKQPIVLE